MHVDTIDLGLPHITPIETIGRGGFSVVYKALDTKLNRHVAVKVLTAFVDQADLDRFDQECRIHGPLSNHPNIVAIHDAGFTPTGHPFLVMEYLHQGSLVDYLARYGTMDWREAVDVLAPICDAVEAAHNRGVLHRDIKPANILLSTEGPKLADFGIACGSDATSHQIAVSWLHAPLEAELNRRDERSDVYSIASTLYELLTGHAPYWREGDESLAALFRRMVEEPVPHLDPAIAPVWLDAVLQRALAKDPADRPASAAELRAMLTNGPNQATTTVQQAVAIPAHAGAGAGAVMAANAHFTTQIGTHTNGLVTSNTVDPNTVHPNSLDAHPFVGGGGARGHEPQQQAQFRRGRRARKGSAVAAVVALAVVGFLLSPAWAAVLPGTANGTGEGDASGTTTTPESTSTTDATDTEPGPTTSELEPVTTSSSSTSTTTTTEKPDPTTTETTAKPTTTSSSTTSTAPPVRSAEVPDVAGLTRDRALDNLRAEGFTDVSVITRSSSTVADGLAIGTDPGKGTVTEVDAPITVAISSGPTLVVMPDVYFLQVADARSQLEAAGLTVTVQLVDADADSGLDGVVLSSNPGAGAEVPVGSNVTLEVGDVAAPSITIPEVIVVPSSTFPPTTLGLVGP